MMDAGKSSQVTQELRDAFKSVEDILRTAGKDAEWLAEALRPIGTAYRDFLFIALFWKLTDASHWNTIAKDPTEFERQVKRYLKGVRFFLYMRSGLKSSNPRNRPAKLEARDKVIYDTRKEHPDWSYESIGREHNLSAPATRDAFKRQEKRERDALKLLKDLVRDLPRDFGV